MRILHDGLTDLLASLNARIGPKVSGRCLSLVPFSLLIEQVTAVYRSLTSGGTVILPARDTVMAVDALGLIRMARPTVAALTPSAIKALHAAVAQLPDAAPEELCRSLFDCDRPPLLTCGGAPVDRRLLGDLADRGIPVFEGYGLSENSSIVSWNCPGQFRKGTVGRPLDHVRVRLEPDGELLIKSSSLFAGYTNADPTACAITEDGWLRTGDLANIDPDGYITIRGRKKNVIITAHGRNVAPEWVEGRYKTIDLVEEAVVIGDGLDELHGLFLIRPNCDLTEATRKIRAFGEAELSGIERVERHHLMHDAPEIRQALFTMTGRPVRAAVRDFLACRNLFSGDHP